MKKDVIRPITPEDVVVAKSDPKVTPPRVVEVFNRLIAKGWDGRQSVVKQNDAVAGIVSAMDVERSVVYANKWLDIEPLFEASGWNVYYDKPGFNESYEPTFTFTKQKERARPLPV